MFGNLSPDGYGNVYLLNKTMKEKTDKPQYKLGLALAGGGARGFAHLGVFDALEEIGLKPDIISGTSAGSLAGALYADGYSSKEIMELFKDVKFGELATTSIPRNSFFKTKGLASFLKKHLRAQTFEELAIPLRVMVSDIEQGEKVLFDSGELIPAILASCAFPIMFEPVKIGNRYFVDGGLFENLPVSAIRKDCEKVIGMNITPLCPMKYSRSFKYMVERSLHYLMISNSLHDRELCDYLIESVELGKYPLFEMNKINEIYQMGYKLASSYFEENKERIQKDFFAPPKQESLLTKIQKLFS